MDLDLDIDLEKLATRPGDAMAAQYVLRDLNALIPQLGDPNRAEAAVAVLQKWADAPGESLRKAVAANFLARARAAFGHPKRVPMAGMARRVMPGETHSMSAGMQHRMGAARQAMPAPRVEHGTEHTPRLSMHPEQAAGAMGGPAPGATMSAHSSGSRVAALAAHHGFKLGLAAAAGAAAGAAVAHGKSKKKPEEKMVEKVASGGDLTKEQRSDAARGRWSARSARPATAAAGG